MANPCPLCGSDMTLDGMWPVESNGVVVDGCHDCFEKQADDMWWEMMRAREEMANA